MIKLLQQFFSQHSRFRTETSKSWIFWAVLGFVGGLSPYIIFVVLVPATKIDKPILLPEPQGIAANSQDHGTTSRTVLDRLPPAAVSQPVPANDARVDNGNEHVRQQERDAMPAAVKAQEPRPAGMTPVAQAVVAKPNEAVPAAATIRNRTAGKATTKNKQPGMMKREPGMNSATAMSSGLLYSSAGSEKQPKAKVENIIDTIVSQRWAQNNRESSFPNSAVIECSSLKEKITCWTNVLTGVHDSREYSYKIKLILNKFGSGNQFVMTYRQLILGDDVKFSEAQTEGFGALPENIKPGWAPMIHNLPCQMVGHDSIVCSPVGESQFVLIGTQTQTSANQ